MKLTTENIVKFLNTVKEVAGQIKEVSERAAQANSPSGVGRPVKDYNINVNTRPQGEQITNDGKLVKDLRASDLEEIRLNSGVKYERITSEIVLEILLLAIEAAKRGTNYFFYDYSNYNLGNDIENRLFESLVTGNVQDQLMVKGFRVKVNKSKKDGSIKFLISW